jgi:hypothetical protein
MLTAMRQWLVGALFFRRPDAAVRRRRWWSNRRGHRFDLTSFLHAGANVITVAAANGPYA